MLQIPTKIFSFLRGIVKFKNLKKIAGTLGRSSRHTCASRARGTPVEKHCSTPMPKSNTNQLAQKFGEINPLDLHLDINITSFVNICTDHTTLVRDRDVVKTRVLSIYHLWLILDLLFLHLHVWKEMGGWWCLLKIKILFHPTLYLPILEQKNCLPHNTKLNVDKKETVYHKCIVWFVFFLRRFMKYCNKFNLNFQFFTLK